MEFKEWINKNITTDDLINEGHTDIIVKTNLSELNNVKLNLRTYQIQYPERTLNWLKKEYIKAHCNGTMENIIQLAFKVRLSTRHIQSLYKEIKGIKTGKPIIRYNNERILIRKGSNKILETPEIAKEADILDIFNYDIG